MRIISKYKDYYDYLQGIWGSDEKLILDRTEFSPKILSYDDFQIITLYICGYKIQGLAMGGEFLWGDDMLPYIEKDRKTGLPKESKKTGGDDGFWMKGFDGFEHMWEIDLPSNFKPWNWTTYYILKYPLLKREPSPNTIENCPILLERWKGQYQHNPILKDLNFHKFWSAEEIWIKLSEWLARQHTEIVHDTRTNKEKVLSAGFDLKTSFRH